MSTLNHYVTLNFPLDLASILAGGIVGFFLVFIVDWVKKPRVKLLGFVPVVFNGGTLHKMRFKVKGLESPGLSCLNIGWCCKNVFAKWDETPNPLEAGNANTFRPELVPATYYQPLFCSREYTVPIVFENNGKYEIFSGWWFGKNSGYGPDPAIGSTVQICLTLNGARLSLSKSFSVNQIIGTR
jgi:hypothetical protein